MKVLFVDSHPTHMTVRLTGMLTVEAIQALGKAGFKVKGITAKDSVLSIIVGYRQ